MKIKIIVLLLLMLGFGMFLSSKNLLPKNFFGMKKSSMNGQVNGTSTQNQVADGQMAMNGSSSSNKQVFVHDSIDPSSLQKFVDALPLPGVLKPTGQNNGVDYYEISMSQAKQKLHRDLPETTIWGYNGLFPGPTIESRSGTPIKIKWINNLPEKHFLPIDTSVMGADNPNDPEVRTVIHLHGGHVPPESDGFPTEWFGPGQSSNVIDYPNNQPATMLWYHDHALGITRLNVITGLAGLYMVRDKVEDAMNLPKGEYEVPLVVQDRIINKDGSLDYPTEANMNGGAMSGTSTGKELPSPSIVPEFFGNTILVNGKAWPFLEVEPRKYRFRVLNGSNSRFYNFSFSNGASFYQIGTEGGFLNKPVAIKKLLLAPAERADIIVDFSKYNGKIITLDNDANGPYPSGDPVDANTSKIMQFKVTKKLTGADTSKIPTTLPKVTKLLEKNSVATRDIALLEKQDDFGRLKLTINGLGFSDASTENPKLGTTEVWNFINPTPDTHPMHIHLVNFQILDRRPFDVAQYEQTGKIVYTGPAVKPDANESDWKDTIRANAGEVTRIIINFNDYAGKYVYHCHILEHEEYDMMRPLDVLP